MDSLQNYMSSRINYWHASLKIRGIQPKINPDSLDIHFTRFFLADKTEEVITALYILATLTESQNCLGERSQKSRKSS